MKFLKILLATWSLTVNAGLPPTTLSSRLQAAKSTFNFKVPNNQATPVTGGMLIETGNDNILVNSNFEDSTLAGWTCTVGTCASTGNSGEFTEGKLAMSVSLTAQAMDVSQSVAIATGSTNQYVIGVHYKVPANISGFQICTLVAGAEKTCVPTVNLITDGFFHAIEIPEVVSTPGSTVGIKFKSTSSSDIAFFDKAYIKQGIGTQNLMLDNVYSASVSSTGVVSAETKDWISQTTCTHTTGTNTCSFVTGTFTVAPNCWLVNTPASISGSSVATTSSVTWETKNNAGTLVDIQTGIACQKSGNDYLASSAAVYSQSSANYSRTSYQPTLTGFGSAVPAQDCYHSRDGEYLVLECNLTAGTTPTAVEARVSLPNSLIVQAFASTTPVGEWYLNSVNTVHGGAVLMTTSTGYVTFSNFGVFGSTSVNPFSTATGATLVASGGLMSFKARIPIAGWSNSSTIVGTFAGTPKVPGLDGNVDTFSVSFGTTNATTVCSASPCSYLDQIGTAVSSITRSTAGVYSLNVARTYAKLKCQVSGWIAGVGGTMTDGTMSCPNCATLAFNTRSDTNTSSDTYGTLMCQGSY